MNTPAGQLPQATPELIRAEMRRVAKTHGAAVIKAGADGTIVIGPDQGKVNALKRQQQAKKDSRKKNREARKTRRKQRGA